MVSASALGRLVGETEGVAHVVGDSLDGLDLVIVAEEDGVSLLLEAEDFLLLGTQGGDVFLLAEYEG